MAKVVIPAAYKRQSTIEILAKWNNVQVEIAEDASVEIPVLTIGDKKATGIPEIAELLGHSSKNAKNWSKITLGDGQKEVAEEIKKFMNIAEETAAKEQNDGTIKNVVSEVSDHLKERRFLASNELTAADVVMYCTFHGIVEKEGGKAKIAHCNIIRWLNHVRALIQDNAAEIECPKTPISALLSALPSAAHVKKEKKEKKAAPAPKKEEEDHDAISDLDIRIGKIIKVEPHPEGDKLYSELIDIGNGVVKKVITGVREYVPIEKMQDRHVVVFCNIKPSKILHLPSEGMVFAGSNEDHTVVELLDPPADTPIGTRVMFGDFCKTEPVACDKKGKLWKAVADHLKIDENGFATYKGQFLTVPEGKISVPSLRNCEFH